MSLTGKTIFITGGSRGIGLALALRAARDGANIAIAAKTAEPHPKLPGTIYSAAQEIEAAGGRALPLIVDVRDEASVIRAVAETVETFGGIDICVNNASAVAKSNIEDTQAKWVDLMFDVNTRGTLLTSKACVPHLAKSENPHILNMSPPLAMEPRWFAHSVAYSISKYGMSMCTLGLAEELRDRGIAVNSIWPRTGIATSAIEFALGSRDELRRCRTPAIIADAAYAILQRPSRSCTGNFFIDDLVLHEEGVQDLEQYRVDPTTDLRIGIFLPEDLPPIPGH